jgi:SAM-dependent methyltransferase
MSEMTDQSQKNLPNGAGRFDAVDYANGFLTVSGWMFLPNHRLDEFRLEINGAPVAADASPGRYEAVQKKIPSLPEALMSGFRWRVSVPEEALAGWIDVVVYGRIRGGDVAQMSTKYRTDYQQCLPDTPVELRYRVTGSRASIVDYRLAGLQSFGKFSQSIDRYFGPGRPRHLLDWGCGCGRVTSMMLKYLGDMEIHGCDIDGEAVAWCSRNLTPGRFTASPPVPPTPYAADTFDVVTGCSVLTHLDRTLQFEWLKEMKRILAPGGLLLASVHGDFATMAFNNPAYVQEEVRAAGISDRTQDHILKGIAPDGYYRGTYQSKEYTCREFACYFDVLEYIELGMGNLQDLVVMRRQAK